MSADLIWATHGRISISLYDLKRFQGYCRSYPRASLAFRSAWRIAFRSTWRIAFRSTWRIGGLGNWL